MTNAQRPSERDSEPQPGATEIDQSKYGIALADAVEASMADFLNRVVQERAVDFNLAQDCGSFASTFEELKASITAAVDGALRAFLTSDVDMQRTTPLTIIRNQMGPVHKFLTSVQCAQANRDPFDEATFPNDVYAIGPSAWADFGETVHEAGLRWGAAKAMAHRQRHVLAR